MLKAVYVDGWNFKQSADRIRSMGGFLECLREKDAMAATRDFGNDETAKHHVKAVLGVIQQHASAGEIMHILNQFPGELFELWVAPV